ncbi:MAG: SMP-30/gluconolactonase/LRE family protein [Pseudomonadota bacterium]
MQANPQPAIEGVIAEGVEHRIIATGLGFTEGPIWHPGEGWLIFSDIAESRQYRWRDGAPLEVFRIPSNQANGNCFDLEGRVVSCEHASSQLVLHDHGGKRVRVLASHYNGQELNSPNDVICDPQGRIWFTDPAFGRLREDLGLLRAQAQPMQGVFRLDPDGTLTCVVDDFQQPNGLCLDLSGTRLFVNDSWGPTIRVFDIEADGRLTGGAVWATITGDGEGVPDGMKIDETGRVYSNGPGGVHVFSPEARHLGIIATPEKSTNFCFGGDDLRTLFVTTCTTVRAIPLLARGLPMIQPGGAPAR